MTKKRTVFAINTPKAEGNIYYGLPKNYCTHTFESIPHASDYVMCVKCNLIKLEK